MNPNSLDVTGPLLAALYLKLAGDATLEGLAPGGIHDTAAPEVSGYPYLIIGDAVETPRNDLATYGAETLADIHLWDRTQSTNDLWTIANRVRGLLDHQPLTIAGHQTVAVLHEQTLTLRDPDPELRHLMVRIRIITEQE